MGHECWLGGHGGSQYAGPPSFGIPLARAPGEAALLWHGTGKDWPPASGPVALLSIPQVLASPPGGSLCSQLCSCSNKACSGGCSSPNHSWVLWAQAPVASQKGSMEQNERLLLAALRLCKLQLQLWSIQVLLAFPAHIPTAATIASM